MNVLLNNITQQRFVFLCKMSNTIILKVSFEIGNANISRMATD
jgi:hypothetical protein